MSKLRRRLALRRRSRENRSPLVAAMLVACASLLLHAAPRVSANQDESPRDLLPNQPIERELAGGERHVYKITLKAGDYLRLSIDPMPQGANVRSQIVGPDGASDIGVIFYPTNGWEHFVSLISETSGDYRLELSPGEKDETMDRYKVEIQELRPATEQDRIHLAAESAEYKGRILLTGANMPGVELTRKKIEGYEEALALWRKCGDRKGELRMLYYLSGDYQSLGEIDKALEYTRQATQVAEMLGDRYRAAGMLVLAGTIYKSQGEYQKALDSYEQGRLIFKSLSKRFGEALTIYSQGLALADLGEYQEAMTRLEEALPVISSLGDVHSECGILNAMAAIHRALGDGRKAVEIHTRAVTIARESKYDDLEAFALTLLGDDNLDLGDRQAALDWYQQSLKIWKSLGEPVYEGKTLKKVGDAEYLLGDYEKARANLNQALLIFQSSRERGREATTFRSLAQVNYSLGNFEEAQKQIEQALAIEESIRTNVVSRQLRETFFAASQTGFALYIDVLMQRHRKNPAAGFAEAALQANERARARSLLEMLSASEADIRQGAPNDLLELERSLEKQINAKAVARAKMVSEKGSASGAVFDKEIAALSERLRDVETQIRQHSPRYGALTQPQPLTADAIRQQLDDDTVLLEFAAGERHSWLWTVTRDSVNSYQLPPGKEIESSARKVYEELTARQPRKAETDQQYLQRVGVAESQFRSDSTALSQMLLGQIAEKLDREWKDKRLAVVASGALEYLPFAALPAPAPQSASGDVKSPRFLISQHEIVNLPSASVLAAIRNETRERAAAEKTIAVLADPVFDLTDPRVLSAMKKSEVGNTPVRVHSRGETADASGSQGQAADTRLLRSLRSLEGNAERGGFSRLPFSREEADAIGSLVPRDGLLKATDFQANRANATNGELSHYRIIHFATHGLLNSERPELSGLVLSLVDENGRPQDGFLGMHEVYNLQLPADVVVLSACQTALGKEIKGEGLVGLTRGFMYAGARRVVASLWQVDDMATAQLMKSFYRGMLKGGLRPAQALRLAQLEMLKQPRWSSPFFWAPFVVQGEWK